MEKEYLNYCKNCNKREKLIKAHITPEWAYINTYPDNKLDSTLSLVLVSTNKPFAKRTPVGIYDSNILCAKCDQYIGNNFDSLGKLALIDTIPVKNQSEEGMSIFSLPNVDPLLLKNFFLSILLRSAWSDKEEYSAVNLPENFLKELSSIVFTNMETDVDTFSVLITRFKEDKNLLASRKFTQVPYKTRIEGLNFFVINISNGYKIFIKVDRRKQLEELMVLTLEKNKPVLFIEYEDFNKSKELEMLRPHLSKIKFRRKV